MEMLLVFFFAPVIYLTHRALQCTACAATAFLVNGIPANKKERLAICGGVAIGFALLAFWPCVQCAFNNDGHGLHSLHPLEHMAWAVGALETSVVMSLLGFAFTAPLRAPKIPETTGVL